MVSIHYFIHVLSVMFPVCGQMKYTAGSQFLRYRISEFILNNSSFMVFLFVPWVRKK